MTELPGEWRKDATCADPGIDPNIFFPSNEDVDSLRRARQICSDCLVKQECYEYAMRHPTLTGVWGGTSHRERSRLKRIQYPDNRDPGQRRPLVIVKRID
jgi:WhiB family redox-sensing transcriptional regulator